MLPVGGYVKEWSHAYDPETTDRLVVILHWEAQPDISVQSVTYRGQAMTRLVGTSINQIYPRHVQIWELKKENLPDAAGEYPVKVEFSGWVKGGGGAYSLGNVHPTVPPITADVTLSRGSNRDIGISSWLPNDDWFGIVGLTSSGTGDYSADEGWIEAWDIQTQSPHGASFYRSENPAARFSFSRFPLDANRDEALALVNYHSLTNDPPKLKAIRDARYLEGSSYVFNISATDSNSDAITLSADLRNLPAGAKFEDHCDGTGTFSWTPLTGEAGTYEGIVFGASDGNAKNVQAIRIEVIPPPQQNVAPQLAPIGDRIVTEGEELHIDIVATDTDGTTPELKSFHKNAHSEFTDNDDGTGVFRFFAREGSAGIYTGIWFSATDEHGAADSEQIKIIVAAVGDDDGDGVLTVDDNCRWIWNPDQTDTDGDTQGRL